MKIKRLLITIFVFLLLTLQVVSATPPDIIHEMLVKITPNTDGSLNISYEFDYEATTDFPPNIQYLQIGVANSDFTLLSL
ncbi:hypothetical protein [Serpentinicella alkaliphila]|uniref:Uncharacterized protein n=1 Tax=Serpentinicella alkaliphila TaxID=1734049 RepID=A0A4R2SWR7_9FIRM|nr:hypothetical protein [Serpentinicella alkaliphila]QUH26385.1 hypothetical protein HZR23_12035 [Serpentinicella alkaliphila]TCP94939.1 hypothetical protein EDD79_10678 [Serpentinicella alkaliphila]